MLLKVMLCFIKMLAWRARRNNARNEGRIIIEDDENDLAPLF